MKKHDVKLPPKRGGYPPTDGGSDYSTFDIPRRRKLKFKFWGMEKQTVKTTSVERSSFIAALTEMEIHDYSTKKIKADNAIFFEFTFDADGNKMLDLGGVFARNLSTMEK